VRATLTKRAPKKKVEENVFEGEPPLPAVVDESPLTAGLSDEEKKEFSKLLVQKLPLDEMANLLVGLAKKKCTKTAAVGLRAIQEINKIRGISKDDREETSNMFVLPPNTKVAIMTETPEE
jgi:hypothetical protein